MSALGSDGGGGLTSLQRPCLYQTVIRLILIREYLCLHPSCPPRPPPPSGNQAAGTMAIKKWEAVILHQPAGVVALEENTHTHKHRHTHYAWQ